MDTLIGLKGKNFIVLAADTNCVTSIIKLKNNDKTKFYDIDGNKCLVVAGQVGDRVQFGEYIRTNAHLYQYINSTNLLVKSLAYFTRKQMAYYLRRNPFNVDCLIAGYDKESGFQLFWCDYLSNMDAVNKGAQGYGGYFCTGILDKYYHENLTLEEALVIFKKCFDELKNRFLLTQINYELRIITEDHMETQYATV